MGRGKKHKIYVDTFGDQSFYDLFFYKSPCLPYESAAGKQVVLR